MTLTERVVLWCAAYFFLITAYGPGARVIPAPWGFWTGVGLAVAGVLAAAVCALVARRRDTTTGRHGRG